MNDKVTDLLHEEIDLMELQREQVAIKVDHIKRGLLDLATKIKDIREIFEAAAVLLENDIADDTTQAVRQGFVITKKQQRAQKESA
jgi:hypothetical protein